MLVQSNMPRGHQTQGGKNMNNFSTLHRFGYSVKLSVNVVSLIPYLSKLYEESVITESDASDCVYSAVNDIPVSYHVRVYNNK